MQEEKTLNIDIRRLLGVLWYRKIVIIIVALVFGVISYVGASTLITPMYEANVMIYVNNHSRSDSSSETIGTGEISAARSLTETYIVMLKSRDCLDKVLENTGVKYSRKELENMISAEAVNETEVFRVTVTSSDPEESRLIADGIADVLPGILTENIDDAASVKVVDHAELPKEKSSPNLVTYATLGFVLGFVLIGGYFVIGELIDDRVHDETNLTQMFDDIPILAVIPHSTSGRNRYGRYGKYGKYGKSGYDKSGYGYDSSGYESAASGDPAKNNKA